MSATLDYEPPLYVERRSLPRRGLRLMVAVAVTLALLPLVEKLVLRHQLYLAVYGVTASGPLLAAAALSALAFSSAVTKVFADRLEISLRLCSFQFWSKRLPLATLKEIALVHNAYPPGKRRFALLRRSPGLTVVIFGGSGLKLGVGDKSQVWLGSDNPEALLAALRQAKGMDLK